MTTIERRYSARYPIKLAVYIRYRKRRFFCATGANLSSQGMFLEVRNVMLPTGTMVELELRALGRDWLIPAVVAHRDAAGIGVMFRELQSELSHGLSQLIEESARPPLPLSTADRRPPA
ncbi:PilZ domain-containing protein [Thiorhodococcus mannitoliphagus]|uniref:PilZ domain-containing protein n=1 Tax=Thiorhodococcus mannitoliphagus TaxID=329406 RepID=A0A6P1DZ56_9GAMM|nr:PilZ domain-containing protein [Thiorhodococcus mannitoliphagus]